MDHFTPKRADFVPRVNLLVFLVMLATAGILWRLFQKSVIEHPQYVAAAENQYEVSEELPPRRGTIYAQDFDKNQHVPIAATEERFNISVVPKNVKDKSQAAKVLSEVFGIDAKETFEKINNDRLYIPSLVRSVSKAKKEEIVQKGFVGLLIEKEYQRVYPGNDVLAHLLGFVNRDNQGNYGLEESYDEELRGVAGNVIGERDTLGRIFSTVKKVEAEDGVSVETAIDNNVQFVVEDILSKALEKTGAQSAQVIVMNPQNGEIITMVALPDFDPNKFNEYPVEEHAKFRNPIISTIYEPGSIMKPIVMSMAIDLGKVEPDTKHTFGSSISVGGYTIENARSRSFGEETMTKVLVNSDNIGMVWVSGHMSNEEMFGAFERFGFGNKTGVDLPSELGGQVLDLKDWREISRATMAFGQGISVTPLQMITGWAAVINGGKLVTPHVVRRLIGERGVAVDVELPVKEGVIKPETSEKLRTMLEAVSKEGFDRKTQLENYRIGAKTGTAQIPDPEKGGYLDDAFTHSVMGFLPADDPKFLVLVKLDRPTSANFASDTTAPIFRDIATYLVNYYQIPPEKVGN